MQIQAAGLLQEITITSSAASGEILQLNEQGEITSTAAIHKVRSLK